MQNWRIVNNHCSRSGKCKKCPPNAPAIVKENLTIGTAATAEESSEVEKTPEVKSARENPHVVQWRTETQSECRWSHCAGERIRQHPLYCKRNFFETGA